MNKGFVILATVMLLLVQGVCGNDRQTTCSLFCEDKDDTVVDAQGMTEWERCLRDCLTDYPTVQPTKMPQPTPFPKPGEFDAHSYGSANIN